MGQESVQVEEPIVEKVFEALTLSKKIGCGTLYCIFNEEEGGFYNIIIKGDNSKETPCGESFMNSTSALLTYALRQSLWDGTAHEALVKHMLGHRCNKYVPNRDHIQSCTDAIGKMVLEYLKSRGFHEEEEAKKEATTHKEDTTNSVVPA